MKMVRILVLSTIPLFITPALAENTALPPAREIAKNTVRLAQDTAITTYLYAKLATQPSLAYDQIDFSTTAGKVTLNGIVNNDAEAQTLTHLAEATSGVKSVDASQLIITQRATPPLPPTTITVSALVPKTAAPRAVTLHSSDPILAAAEKTDAAHPPALSPKKTKPTPHHLKPAPHRKKSTHHSSSKKKKLKKSKKPHSHSKPRKQG